MLGLTWRGSIWSFFVLIVNPEEKTKWLSRLEAKIYKDPKSYGNHRSKAIQYTTRMYRLIVKLGKEKIPKLCIILEKKEEEEEEKKINPSHATKDN